jgi:DNA-binding CsgD family transcriptional regulator
MQRVGNVLETVRRLYGAVLDADDWSDSLSAILTPLAASRTFFVRQDMVSGTVAVATDRCNEAAHVVRYEAAAAAGFVPAWRRAIPQGLVVRSSQMQVDTAYIRTPFYNEVVRPAGDFYGLVAQVARNGRRDAFLCVSKPEGAADFNRKDVATLRQLVPHLATALALKERLADLEIYATDMRVALDRLEDGLLLLDASARPIFSNRAGQTMLTAEPALAMALAELTGPRRSTLQQGGAFDVLRDARAPLRLRVAPIGAEGQVSWLPDHAVAAVFVSDPEAADRRCREALALTYALTPAETRFAQEITKGDGRAAAARRLGISPLTARAHLSRIFEKTGTHRQAELVRLLLAATPR